MSSSASSSVSILRPALSWSSSASSLSSRSSLLSSPKKSVFINDDSCTVAEKKKRGRRKKSENNDTIAGGVGTIMTCRRGRKRKCSNNNISGHGVDNVDEFCHNDIVESSLLSRKHLKNATTVSTTVASPSSPVVSSLSTSPLLSLSVSSPVSSVSSSEVVSLSSSSSSPLSMEISSLLIFTPDNEKLLKFVMRLERYLRLYFKLPIVVMNNHRGNANREQVKNVKSRVNQGKLTDVSSGEIVRQIISLLTSVHNYDTADEKELTTPLSTTLSMSGNNNSSYRSRYVSDSQIFQVMRLVLLNYLYDTYIRLLVSGRQRLVLQIDFIGSFTFVWSLARAYKLDPTLLAMKQQQQLQRQQTQYSTQQQEVSFEHQTIVTDVQWFSEKMDNIRRLANIDILMSECTEFLESVAMYYDDRQKSDHRAENGGGDGGGETNILRSVVDGFAFDTCDNESNLAYEKHDGVDDRRTSDDDDDSRERSKELNIYNSAVLVSSSSSVSSSLSSMIVDPLNHMKTYYDVTLESALFDHSDHYDTAFVPYYRFSDSSMSVFNMSRYIGHTMRENIRSLYRYVNTFVRQSCNNVETETNDVTMIMPCPCVVLFNLFIRDNYRMYHSKSLRQSSYVEIRCTNGTILKLSYMIITNMFPRINSWFKSIHNQLTKKTGKMHIQHLDSYVRLIAQNTARKNTTIADSMTNSSSDTRDIVGIDVAVINRKSDEKRTCNDVENNGVYMSHLNELSNDDGTLGFGVNRRKTEYSSSTCSTRTTVSPCTMMSVATATRTIESSIAPGRGVRRQRRGRRSFVSKRLQQLSDNNNNGTSGSTDYFFDGNGNNFAVSAGQENKYCRMIVKKRGGGNGGGRCRRRYTITRRRSVVLGNKENEDTTTEESSKRLGEKKCGTISRSSNRGKKNGNVIGDRFNKKLKIMGTSGKSENNSVTMADTTATTTAAVPGNNNVSLSSQRLSLASLYQSVPREINVLADIFSTAYVACKHEHVKRTYEQLRSNDEDATLVRICLDCGKRV